MKSTSRFLLTLLACTAAILSATTATATTVHAGYGAAYSVTVDPQSNIFDSSIGFDGNVLVGDTHYSSTYLGGYYMGGAPHNPGYDTIYTGQHLTATFTADLGSAFNSVSMNFGPWSWQTPYSQGGYLTRGSWSVSAGSYVGTESYSYTDYAWRDYRWDAAGNSGSFYYSDGWSNSGGSHGSRGLMDGVIQLPNVTQFTISLDMSGSVRSSSWYSISNLEIALGLTDAPISPPPSVPDMGNTCRLLLLAFAGLLVGNWIFRGRGLTVRAPGWGAK
jgi:hypothetical protein